MTVQGLAWRCLPALATQGGEDGAPGQAWARVGLGWQGAGDTWCVRCPLPGPQSLEIVAWT